MPVWRSTTWAPLDRVWATIIDPSTYPQWLIGTQEVRTIDADWPAIGSEFRHRVGLGPITLGDHTLITDIVPGRYLALAVKARPFVSAHARFELITDGTRTVVLLEEEPALRIIGNLFRPALDLAGAVSSHAGRRGW